MAITLCGSGCTFDDKNTFKPCGDPQVSYEGAVLHTYERNGYDDSDFYAIVWDTESKTFKHIEYASTRGWTYHNGATVDATEAVKAEAEAKLAVIITERWIAQAKIEAVTPTKGKRVRSLTTRGKNAGVEGVVMWRGEQRSQYGTWSKGFKVGFKVEGESKLRYVMEDKLEVLDPPAVDEAEIARQAKQRASQRGWRIDF